MLADGNIHYHKPITREPRAVAKLIDMNGDLSSLKSGQNARVNLKSQVFDGDKPVAEFTGQFVVLAKK